MNYSIRLELDYLKIERKRKRWNIYFLIVAENPTDPSKTVVTATPNSPILVRSLDNNELHFESQGAGDPNGLIVLERDMPADKTMRLSIWVVQSREKERNAGEFLEKLNGKVNGSGNGIGKNIVHLLGNTNPWLGIAKDMVEVGGKVGELLEEMQDKKKGFITLDEGFSQGEIDSGEVDRSGQISAFGELGWTWIIDKKIN